MRVWWRSADAWRVDKLLATGEQDLVHNAQGTTRWRYEQDDVTLSRDPDIRLPRTADLVPPEVADLLLDDVDESEVRRLPAARVAGVDALGLRLVPAAPQTSIDHVDVWADPDTGVVLRVEVFGKGPGDAGVHLGVRGVLGGHAAGRAHRASWCRAARTSSSTRCSTSPTRPTSTRPCCRPTPSPAWPRRRRPTGPSASTAPA